MEVSKRDPLPKPVENESPGPIIYNVVEEGTTHLRGKLVDSLGFSYTVKEEKSNATYWCCTVRNKKPRCLATVIERDGQYTRGKREHIHTAQLDTLTSTLAAREAESPSWVHLFDGVFDTETSSGYVKNGDTAMQVVKAFEKASRTKFINYRTGSKKPHMFGTTDYQDNKNRIEWEIRDRTTRRVLIPFNGVPFIILATRRMECEYGPDRNSFNKIKHLKRSKENPSIKSRFLKWDTKKMGCEARIAMYEVMRFPDYKQLDFDSRAIRTKMSTLLKSHLSERLLTSTGLSEERTIYISLPLLTDHSGHTVGKNLKKGDQVEMLINGVRVDIDAELAEYYSADTESLIKLVGQIPLKEDTESLIKPVGQIPLKGDLSIEKCIKDCVKGSDINRHYHCPGCECVLTSPATVGAHLKTCVGIKQHKTPDHVKNQPRKQEKFDETGVGVNFHDIATNSFDSTATNVYGVDSETDASKTKDLSPIEVFGSISATFSQPFLKAFDFMDKDAAERLFMDAAKTASVEFSSVPGIDPHYPMCSLQGSLEGIVRTESILHESFKKVRDSVQLKTPLLKDLKLFCTEENQTTELSEILLNTPKESNNSSTSLENRESLDDNSQREPTSVAKQDFAINKRVTVDTSMLQSSKKAKGTFNEQPDGKSLPPSKTKVAINLQNIPANVPSKFPDIKTPSTVMTPGKQTAIVYSKIHDHRDEFLEVLTFTADGEKQPNPCIQLPQSFKRLWSQSTNGKTSTSSSMSSSSTVSQCLSTGSPLMSSQEDKDVLRTVQSIESEIDQGPNFGVESSVEAEGKEAFSVFVDNVACRSLVNQPKKGIQTAALKPQCLAQTINKVKEFVKSPCLDPWDIVKKQGLYKPTCNLRVKENEESQKSKEERRFKYICSYCGIRFINKRALSEHTNAHKGIKPYKCKKCGKSFAYINVLMKHKQVKHGVKMQHKCALCPKTFRFEETLKSHMVTHTGSSEHRCDYCQGVFTNRRILKAHIPNCKSYKETLEYEAEQSGQVYEEMEISSSMTQTQLLANDTLLMPDEFGTDEENKNEEQLFTEEGDSILQDSFLYMCSACQMTFSDLSTAEHHLNHCQRETDPESME